MKLLTPWLAAAVLAVPTACPAGEDAAKKKEYFEQFKAERLKHIKARQDLLAQEYACLQGASSTESMKACDEKQRSAHQALEEQHKRERMQKMQEQETKRRADYDRRMQEMQGQSGKK